MTPHPRDKVRGPTIYDVARAAGVAPSTVSRTFARPGRVNADTAARVRTVASELGYRANPLASALPTGRTRMIALVVADVTNPVHFGIIRGAEAAAREAGYTMMLADAQEVPQRERQFLDRALPIVEGVVLASPRMSDSAIRMVAKQRPMVVLNRSVADVPSVVTDTARGMRRAAEHLGSLGHRHIAYVAGPEASWTDGMRWRALREAALELDLEIRRTGPCPPTVRGGTAAAAEVLREPATAVIAYNDLIAIGLLRGFQSAGCRIPDDMSIVGNDDIFGADLATPPLTTVAAPLRLLGTTAVEHLLAVAGGARPRTGTPVVVPTQLVTRESTSPPGRPGGARSSG